jgi:hypothetical protein
MFDKEDLEHIGRDREILERWHEYSRHVIARLLEGCAVCGKVTEKRNLSRCRLCHDTYYCKSGCCSYRHYAATHPVDAHWR